jgi:hypothetical protein
VRNAPANQDVSGSIEKLLVLAFDLALFQRVLSHVDLTQLKLTIKRVHVLVTFSIKRPDIDDPGSIVTTSRASNDGGGIHDTKTVPPGIPPERRASLRQDKANPRWGESGSSMKPLGITH